MTFPAVKVVSGGLAVSQAPAGFGTPFRLGTSGIAITPVASGGLPITDSGTGIFGVATTWDTATLAGVNLSGDKLTATSTGTTSTNQGARIADAAGKSTGKYYFEFLWQAFLGGASVGVGVGTTVSTYANIGGTGTTGAHIFAATGQAWSNSAIIGNIGSAYTTGQIGAAAVDLDNRKIWFRKSTPLGNWNNNVANNPASNVGGWVIPAGVMVPFVTFGGSAGVASNVVAANFGASAFAGAVPAGFTSGWP